MLACDWNGHSYSASTIRAAPEGRVDLARRDRHLAFDDRRLTDVVVECRLFGEGRHRLGPGDLEPLGCLHRVPFALRDDAEKPLSRTTRTPGMSRTEPSSTATGTAPATGGRIMRPCSIPGTLMSVT